LWVGSKKKKKKATERANLPWLARELEPNRILFPDRLTSISFLVGKKIIQEEDIYVPSENCWREFYIIIE
jgi:hypothetical protein